MGRDRNHKKFIRKLAQALLAGRKAIEFPYRDSSKLDNAFWSQEALIKERADELTKQVSPFDELNDYAAKLKFDDPETLRFIYRDMIENCVAYRARCEFGLEFREFKALRTELKRSRAEFQRFVERLQKVVACDEPLGFNFHAPLAWQAANKTFAALQSAAHVCDDLPGLPGSPDLDDRPPGFTQHTRDALSLPGAITNIDHALKAAIDHVDSQIPKGHSAHVWKQQNADSVVVSWLLSQLGNKESLERNLPSGRDWSQAFLLDALDCIWGRNRNSDKTRERYFFKATRRVREATAKAEREMHCDPAFVKFAVETERDIAIAQPGDSHVRDFLAVAYEIKNHWDSKLPVNVNFNPMDPAIDHLAEHGSENWSIPLN